MTLPDLRTLFSNIPFLRQATTREVRAIGVNLSTPLDPGRAAALAAYNDRAAKTHELIESFRFEESGGQPPPRE